MANKPITAPSATPVDSGTDKTAKIYETSDAAGVNTVAIQDAVANAQVLLRGSGDTVMIESFAEAFQVKVSGKTLTLKSDEQTIKIVLNSMIKANAVSAKLVFLNGELSLSKAAGSTVVTLGDQQMKKKFFDLTAATTSNQTASNYFDDETGGGATGSTPVTLTVNSDTLTGDSTANNFKGRIGTVDGAEANTLNSGDSIDGKDGTDTLQVQVMAGTTVVNGSWLRPIQPEIQNVEIIKIESQYRDLDAEDADEVVIRAAEITDVQQLWSYNSTADLIIQDLTTRKSNGGVGNTKDMTIGMAYTGNDDDNWTESNYNVYFDQDYLTTSQLSEGSELYLELMDMDAALAGRDPLEDMLVTGIRFTMDGVEKVLNFGSASNTYPQLLAAIQAALAANPAFANLVAELGPQFTASDTDSEPGGSAQGTSIVIRNNGPEVLAPASNIFNQGTIDPNKDFHTRITSTPPGTEGVPVEINIALEKVGDSGDGGHLIIGSMNKDDEDSNTLPGWGEDVVSTYNDTVAGFEKFNVTVLGNASKPSSLAELRSTNNTLETVIVKSETRTDNSYAALIIGNQNIDGEYFNDVIPGLKDVRTFDASAFKGNLTLNAVLTAESGDKYTNSDERVFEYTSGTGNDTITIATGEDFFNTELGGFELHIDTNSGDDTVNLSIGEDALDYANSLIHVTTGDGNDNVNIHTDFGAWICDSESIEDYTNQLLNQAILDNVTIETGAGDDNVVIDGLGNFNILTGDGNDFIQTSDFDWSNWQASTPDNSPDHATWVFNVDQQRYFNDPPWEGLDNLPGIAPALNYIGGATLTVTLSGAGAWYDEEIGDGGGVMSLYQAERYIDGYESKVTIDVAGPNEFYGTQIDINNAILKAINDDVVLGKLLHAYIGSNNTLVVESLVDGGFDREDLLVEIDQVAWTSQNYANRVATEARNVFSNSAITEDELFNGGADDADDTYQNDGDYHAVLSDDYYAGLGYEDYSDSEREDYDDLETIMYSGGEESPYETDNVINAGNGNDIIVLSTDADDAELNSFIEENAPLKNGASNETIVLTGDNFGNDTVMNFSAAFMGFSDGDDDNGYYSDDETVDGVDFLDFTSYLTSTYDHSENDTADSDSFIPIAVTLDNDGDNTAIIDANEVVILQFDNTDIASESWANLNAAVIQNLFNSGTFDGDSEYGNLVGGNLSANDEYSPEDLISGAAKGIVMVENLDNWGEYKVFQLSWNGAANADGDGDYDGVVTATLLGSLDFGSTLTYFPDSDDEGVLLGEVNLVGSAEYVDMLAEGLYGYT